MQVYSLYARGHPYIIPGINMAGIICYQMNPENAPGHRLTQEEYHPAAGLLSFIAISGYNYLK